MIGKISIGRSFKGCIQYCLNNKKTEDNPGEKKNRAEVLKYNLCYGNANELTRQFNEVRALNQRLNKPVMHVTLSFAPGEILSPQKLVQIGDECAEHLGFSNNQFLLLTHDDTGHQHMHIVVNRIGLDGKTLSDSNNFKKIAAFCRAMEAKYDLRSVESPRRFLPKEKRNLPRNDQRKVQLKKRIVAALQQAKDYAQFESYLKGIGYQVLKARGIAFIDPKKVRIKGSEVGFSLGRIEHYLSLPPAQRAYVLLKKTSFNNQGKNDPMQPIKQPAKSIAVRDKNNALQITMDPAPLNEDLNGSIKPKKRKKRRLL